MTKHESSIPISLLKKLLRLDEVTGKLYFKERPEELFSSERQPAHISCSSWNAKYANKEAMNTKQGMGYLHGALMGEKVLAHRAVYAISNNEWPKGEVDHINGIKTDNRPENLRATSHETNMRNQRLRKTNTSGFNGVSYNKSRKQYEVYIYANGRKTNLGRFATLDEAIEAREVANKEHGYHENHGRAA